MTKEQAKQKISDLVERFGEQIDSYKKSDYNETLTRRDFIDPFFKALGWDIDNEQGYAEAYREVIHEDRVKVGSATKAPDYSFRLVGGKRLFFVEAKKPSVAVKDEILPAYQIRRYGWSAKLPISLITDFEELAVYDCTKKPNPTDKASVARIKYLTFKDYIKEFDFLWDTFSKERVLKGSFDKFVQGNASKKGTATVDREFLNSLDTWRTYLAQSISLNNKQLNEDELNFVVQQTIDRIIFLRIAEDRAVEPYGNLKTSLKGDCYDNLFQLFIEADQKYNSGLFDFKKDKISATIKVDNKVIKNIINELYYPESPYEFSVLSVEILGSAYEQFLGKVIRLTPAHHAKIEEKPEVRKAGGVYYTPQYIVDYIVEKTIGKLIEGKSPNEISKIKIVDPACGSGSFLIGAYQFLLDYHKNFYTENGKISKGKKESPLTPEGNLTTSEKKKILLNNIFGVDLDFNAVEVTKLSLLLKCMEGETQASIANQIKLFNERVLPTLDSNIKDGNTLVDTDYYDEKIDFGFERKIKPFNWKNAFPDIFKNDGFDVVIGNPPYVAIDSISQTERDYFTTKYPEIKKRLDLFGLFMDRGRRLLNNNGKMGFIIPMQFLRNSAFELLRKSIIQNNHIDEINAVGDKVFEQAKNDTIIILLSKEKTKSPSRLIESKTTNTNLYTVKENTVNQDLFLNNKEYTFDLSSSGSREIFHKIEKNTLRIKERFDVIQGIVSGLNEAYIYRNDSLPKIEKQLLKPFAFGSDFDRYTLRKIEHSIIYANKDIDIKDFPKCLEILKPYKKQLDKRREVVKNVLPWYSLQWPRAKSSFERPKILFQKIRNQKLPQRLVGTYDESKLFLGDGVIFLNSMLDDKNELKFLLAILNSHLYNFYYREQFLDINLKIKYLEDTLVVDYTKFNKSDKNRFDEVVKLVDSLLSTHEQINKSNLTATQLTDKADHYERKINEIINSLYNISPEEYEAIKENLGVK